jgi:predicted transcriptional regulator with HTH domain
LKELGLIEFGNNSHFKPAKLTQLGKFVVSIIKDTHLITHKDLSLPVSDVHEVKK